MTCILRPRSCTARRVAQCKGELYDAGTPGRNAHRVVQKDCRQDEKQEREDGQCHRASRRHRARRSIARHAPLWARRRHKGAVSERQERMGIVAGRAHVVELAVTLRHAPGCCNFASPDQGRRQQGRGVRKATEDGQCGRASRRWRDSEVAQPGAWRHVPGSSTTWACPSTMPILSCLSKTAPPLWLPMLAGREVAQPGAWRHVTGSSRTPARPTTLPILSRVYETGSATATILLHESMVIATGRSFVVELSVTLWHARGCATSRPKSTSHDTMRAVSEGGERMGNVDGRARVLDLAVTLWHARVCATRWHARRWASHDPIDAVSKEERGCAMWPGKHAPWSSQLHCDTHRPV